MEPHTGLNNLDFIVLGILLLSGILAMFRGFVREVLSLASWTIAYFVAAKYHYLAEPWVHKHVQNQTGVILVAAAGIFLLVILICAIISNIIVGLVRGKALNAIDRSLGFGFGLLRGALVVCIVYLAATAIWWPDMDKTPSEKPAIEKVEKETSTDKPNIVHVKDVSQPPDWVMEAKTRPWLSRGAVVLRTFIPEKDIKSATSQLDAQKASAQHIIDQKSLDILSTPTPATKDSTAPAYDTNNRDSLNQLINQKSQQP
jgi:membrane protein required for colicin V production